MKAVLTKEEKARIPFVKALILKSGNNFISGKKICDIVNKNRPMKDSVMTGERLRRMLHHARLNEASTKRVIIASGKGYKYSTNKDEISNYIMSLMDRADSIIALSKAVRRVL